MTVITGNKSNVEIIILQHEFLNVDLHLDVQAILLINSWWGLGEVMDEIL